MILSEARAKAWQLATAVCAVLAVAAVIVALFLGWRGAVANSARALAESERDAARSEVHELRGVIEAERANAKKLADIAARYEQEKADAERTAAATASDLLAGTKRLRHEIGALYTAQLSQASAHSAELAAAAERGAEAIGAAVAVGAACDARDRAWRAVAETDRGN